MIVLKRQSATSAATAVTKSGDIAEARPPEISKHGTTESELAEFADEVRPPGNATHRATPEAELAESSADTSGGAGPSGSREHVTTVATATADPKSVDEARPPGFVTHCAVSESESEVDSLDEESSDGAAVLLRTAMLVPDTRAVWDSISQMKDSDEKDALRQKLCGFLQRRLAAAQASVADG